tara:strand:- start:7206 stop:7397 length:192 start_codon:yes stop_codon:yes gene_type:complete
MHKLEQIESFGAFLDFLSNPNEYKQKAKIVKLEGEYNTKLANVKKDAQDLKQKFAEIAAVAGG